MQFGVWYLERVYGRVNAEFSLHEVTVTMSESRCEIYEIEASMRAMAAARAA